MKIKGFDKDLKCRGYQFEVGKEYKIESKELKLCSDTVFHYCDGLQKVHYFYSCTNESNRFCEIEPLGEEISDDVKCGSNHIKIVREIKGDELDILKGRINGNSGIFNTGDYNTGDYNTGDRNTGYYNTGNRNTGNRNTGDFNTGYYNTGDRNTGDYNTGYYNTGDRNTGDFNTGYYNTGNRNTGNRNTGDYNTGDRNTGDFNSCDYSTGVFCNQEDSNIRIFNIPSGMSYSEFKYSKYNDAINSAQFILTEWKQYTENEMDIDCDKKIIGGYLKKYSYKEACANWWNRMTETNKKIIMSIPNFNAEIFKDITGIEV